MNSLILLAILGMSLSEPSWGSTTSDPQIGPNTVAHLLYGDSGYKFQIIPLSATPPIGFELPEFDDANFNTGSAAFGSRNSCSLTSTVQTDWPINTQLLLRRVISVPPGARKVRILASVDNDIIAVFFNGKRIAENIIHEGCANRDEILIDVPKDKVQPGDNLLAFHVQDRGVESFFDARVLSEMSTDTLTRSLDNIASIVDRQLPKVPVTDIKIQCPRGTQHQPPEPIKIEFHVEATGSAGMITLDMHEPNNFRKEYSLDGKVLASITKTIGQVVTTTSPELEDATNFDRGILALDTDLTHPQIADEVTTCVVNSRISSTFTRRPGEPDEDCIKRCVDEWKLMCKRAQIDEYAVLGFAAAVTSLGGPIGIGADLLGGVVGKGFLDRAELSCEAKAQDYCTTACRGMP
jgi:hypothetical protein